MSDIPALHIVSTEASDATCYDTAVTKTIGKGLTWNEEENFALAQAAAAVYTDPAVGKSMTAADMNRKIRSVFIRDNSKPKDAGTTKDKGPLDARRWDGRSFIACGRQWEILRRECTKFKGFLDRIIGMKLTGNPSEEDLYGCASLIYSEGSQSMSYVYDCIRNPAYHIARPFKFDKTFLFLSTQTTLINATGVDPDKKKQVERPIGTKKAKKMKELKREVDARDDGSSISGSIKRIEEMLVKNAEQRNQISQRKLSFQREKMEWEMAKNLMGPGSNVSVGERDSISSLLRKRLMSSLCRDFDGNPDKRSRTSSEETVSGGDTGIVKTSSRSQDDAQQVVSSVSNEDTSNSF